MGSEVCSRSIHVKVYINLIVFLFVSSVVLHGERFQFAEQCPMIISCEKSSSQDSCCSEHCSCNERCMHTKSCCNDTVRNDNLPSFRTTCETGFIKTSYYYQMARSNSHLIRYDYHYEMVVDCADGTTCPTLGTDPEYEAFADIVAVFSSEENVLFMNSRCAECNGVYEYVRWHLLGIDCADEVHNKNVIGKNARIKSILSSCVLLSYPPSDDLEKYRCYKESNVTKTCNETGLWGGAEQYLEDYCLDPFANIPVKNKFYGDILYKNVFCLLCNNPDYYDKDNLFCHGSKTGIFKSFGTVLDINLDSISTPKDTSNDDEHFCDEHEYFDSFHGFCRQLFCSAHMLPSFGKCVDEPAPLIKRGAYVDVAIGLIPIDLLLKDDLIIRNVTEEYAIFKQDILGKLITALDAPECNVTLYIREMTFQFNIAGIVEYAVVFIEFTRDKICDSAYIIRTISCLHIKQKTISIILNRKTIEWTVELYFFRPIDVFSNDHVIIFIASLSDYSPNVLNAALLVYPLFCPHIRISESEYCQIVGSNCNKSRGLFFPNKRTCPITFDTIFDASDQTYLVCLDAYKKLIKPSHAVTTAPTLKGMFSLVVSCTSMCSIIVSLYIFLKLNKINNAPIIVYICAMVNLFLAQAVFQFGSGWTEFPEVCEPIGMALHYFWLTAVFAMNAYCVIMVKFIDSVHHPFRQIVLTACLYIYGLPVCFVLVNILYSNIVSGGPKLVSGYGGESCHISSREMRLSLFAAPILITVICNCIVYARTVCKIMSISVAVSNNRKPGAYVVVYVRLLLVTGISWCIGFVNEFIQVETLEFMFILFVAGQGIFLLISICVSNPVRDHLFACSFFKMRTAGPRDLSKTISTHINSDNGKNLAMSNS